MTFATIKLKETDTRFTLKPTRIAEIKTRFGTIETPLRAATMFEYNSKAKIPTNILINNPITLKYTSLGYGTLKNFLNTNEVFANLYHALENSKDRTQHSPLQFAVFQPTITRNIEENIPPAMEILQSGYELEKFLDLIIALQESLNFDIISLPYLTLPYSNLERIYKKRTEQIRRSGKEPFFILHLKLTPTSDFEKLLNLFVNDLQIQLIGLRFQRFHEAAVNYHTLSKFYNKDVLFFTMQTGRSDPTYDDISSSHYLPFLTNDIFSVAAPQTFDPNKGKNKLKKIDEQKTIGYHDRLLKLRLFNKKNLKLQTIFPLMDQYKNLLQDVDNPRDYRLETMLQNYLVEVENKEERNERFKNLKYFTWVHELKSSSSEFSNFRKYVKQGDTKSYVSDHPLLSNALTDMK